jgi:hypothetical protein
MVFVHVCVNAEPVYWVMANTAPPFSPLTPGNTMRIPVQRYIPEPHTPEAMLSDEERCCIERLSNHLAENATHYNRAMWFAEDRGQRARRFEKIPFNGGLSLLDLVENVVLDVVGDWVAFPINVGLEREVLRPFRIEQFGSAGRDQFVEQLLTLPTRGVFAEAKLGHCNASETIDTTRFWDWQTSPIPDNAPPITGADAGSRHQAAQGLTPSPLPASLLNIVNPPNAPDPTGMTAAMGLFSAMGGFRDMSAAKEVGALLQTLSNNATALASQGQKGAQTKQLIDQIRDAKEIPPARRADLIGGVLTGQVQSQNQQQAQGQTSTQGQTVTQGSPTAQGGSAQAGGGSGGNATATGGTGIGVGIGGGAVRSQKPKVSKVEDSGLVVLEFVLSGFDNGEIVQIVKIWGNYRQKGATYVEFLDFNPSDILAGAVVAKSKTFTDNGSFYLVVDIGAQKLLGVGNYTVTPANKIGTIQVIAIYREEKVKTKKLGVAKLEFAAKLKPEWGVELPIDFIKVKSGLSPEIGGGISVSGELQEEREFVLRALSPNLEFKQL